MKKHTRLFSLLLFICPLPLKAQDTASFGDELLATGKIQEAAAQYELTGRLNGDNSELLYKAAEAYYRVRDYQKAAECYGFVREEYERYELAGLRYARALKQEGRYDEAMDAFRQFARQYKGQRKAQIMAVVTNEVKGCELAVQMARQKASAVMPAEVKILPAWVNTPENEFSPVLFSDNLLYYSTISNGQVRLMRSQRQAGAWQRPAPAQGLPDAVAARFGNGAFSPDGNRFYCTQCAEPATAERVGNGLRTICSLYMLRRTANGWSEPQRLRDYINMPNRTTTHPFVTKERGRELLFFASDREGGFGGLDLYVCERPLDSDDLDFSFPQNLGNSVNTAGDEVTPFFDPAAQTMWFSSSSHLSVGGLDVFKSVRSGGKWSKPENAGFPVNSPADDFFFFLKKSGGGFLVSNRSFGEDKTNTLDEDIFEFYAKEPPVALVGKVLENGSGQPLTDCMAALYELNDEGEWRLLEVRPSADGAFQFSILPDRQYKVEASKEGFVTLSARPNVIEPVLIIELERSSDGTKPAPVFAVQKGPGAPDLLSDSPVSVGQQGLSYKIHLEVQPDFESQAPRYEEARNFGQVIAEPLPEQGIIRVLLGDFSNLKSANEVAAALRKSGSFPQAFVLKNANENKN